MTSGIEVRGGVGGLQVQYDELSRTSARLKEEGLGLLEMAAARHRLLVDGDLLESAVLSPGGFARVEAALLDALDGPDGLVAAGAALELRSGQLLLAVTRYRMSDVLDDEAAALRRWVMVLTTPAWLPAAAVYSAGWAATVAARGGDPLVELERVLVEHPGVVDEVVGTAAMLTWPLRSGLAGPLPVLADQAFRASNGEALLPRDLTEIAGLLALLYADGSAVWRSRRDGAHHAILVPGGIGDVLERLDHRSRRADEEHGTPGDIGVTRIVTTGADGRDVVSWVVDIPGTKDWQFDPRSRPELNDLASNLELMAGRDNARVEALAGLLTEAGAQPGEPVMLVGHSQGGMVAMRGAQELAGRFAVTHVVTAGSPVGGMPIPPGVQVLSLEDRRDIVPHTDGRENPDSANLVTVHFDSGGTTVLETHSMKTSYAPAAHALDESADPSVRAWLDGAEQFLAGPGEQVTARTTVFTLTNDEDGDGR